MKEDARDTLKQHGISEHILELEQRVQIKSSTDLPTSLPFPRQETLVPNYFTQCKA